MKKLWLVLLLLLFCYSSAPAEMYKWVDADGVVHFTNTSPPQDASKIDSMHETKSAPVSSDKNSSAIPINRSYNQLIKDAYAGLKKLQARCQAGISYQDYAPAFGEAKYSLNMFLDNQDASLYPEEADSLRATTKYYEEALAVWRYKVESNYPDYGLLHNDLGNMMLTICPELEPDGERYPLYAFLSCVWNKATTELNKLDERIK